MNVQHRVRRLFGGLLALTLGLIAVPNALARTDLVFIVDGSGSVSSTDWSIQKAGIVSAIQNPLIVPRDGSIGMAVVQFSSSARVEMAYRIINAQADINAAVSIINGMRQMNASTGPGEGIEVADNHLRGTSGILPEDFQSFCLSTDGTTNTGTSLSTALAGAKAAVYELDRFSVIGIEDPPFFYASDAQSHYGPHVFGGGAVFVVQNSTEFASTIGALCLGQPLKLVGLEVTQVIQDLENSINLIEHKDTLVRAYIEPVSGTDPVKAQARLRGYRSGTELSGSPLTPVNPGAAITAQPNALDRRSTLNDSLNFRIPSDWLTGTVTFELEPIGGSLDCQEAAGPTANDCETTVTFNTGSEFEAKLVRVRYTSDGTVISPSNADLNNIEARTLSILPTSQIDRTTGVLDFGDLGTGHPTLSQINSRLERMRFLDFCWSLFGCDRLYFGAIDQNSDTCCGLANGIPGTVSSGVVRDGNGYFRFTPAHEMSHTMGRHHAANQAEFGTEVTRSGTTLKLGPCGSKANLSGPDFPNIASISGIPRATIGPMDEGDDALIFGWDSLRNIAVDPNQSFELMSYCKPNARWISDFTYEGLRNHINSEYSTVSLALAGSASLASVPTAVGDVYMLFSGLIDLVNDQASFSPVANFQSDVTPPAMPAGDYDLVLLDASGTELDRIAFAPTIFHEDSDGTGDDAPTAGMFLIPVMEDSAIVEARIELGGGTIGSLEASANAPTVTVTYPNGGEILNPPSVDLQWSGSDDDGDPLTYTVQFSPDGGTTWESLTTEYSGTSLSVNLEDLGETDQGLIQVQASDGWHTATDVSDGTFTTPNTAPDCEIQSPSNGELFVGVQQIQFQATGSDKEDGALSLVQWSSSLNGNLGNGNPYLKSADTLNAGTHTITMTCSDSGGLQDTDQVVIEVQRVVVQQKGDADGDGDIDRNDLTVILNSRNTPTASSTCGDICDMNSDGIIDMRDMRLASQQCTRTRCSP